MNRKITTKAPHAKQLLDQYLKTKVNERFNNNFTKNTLLMLAPFAASALMTNQLSAQSCGEYPGGVVNSTGIYMGCPDIYIDIDGDGVNDINMFLYGNDVYFNVLNTSNLSVLGTNTSYSFFYAGNATGTFSAGYFPDTDTNFGTIAWFSYSGAPGGNNNFALSGTGFIPITFNGNLGFIEISLDAGGCITVGSFGVEDVAGGIDGPGTVIPGDCSSLLPVEMVSFVSKIVDKNIRLTWETASEINNLGFEVQRSRDGSNFQKVGFVEGVGNSTRNEEYSFIDKNTKSNVEYYYRLKQMDFDGNSEFTDIIKEMVTDASKIAVGDFAPNPASNQVSLDIVSGTGSNSSIVLFNNAGSIVLESSNQLIQGSNRIDLDVSNLPGGSYFAKVMVGDEVSYKKIMVVK